MNRHESVVRTKITPPRTGPRTLVRERVTAILADALNHRLTLVQAGAGFGKTTALAALAGPAGPGRPLMWYQIMEEDRDPPVFLLHLCHAARQAVPGLGEPAGALLELWDGAGGPPASTRVLDELLNSFSLGLDGPALLVLDDVHLALGAAEIAHLIDRLVALAPPDLHIVLTGRRPLSLPNLSRWKAQGMVRQIDRKDLAFTTTEIMALFADAYGYALTAEEANLLHEATEGWAIALQLVWQSLRGGAYGSVEDVLSNQTASLDTLFNLLATEIFEGQPADVQEFLRATSVLRVITPEACDALQIGPGAAAMPAYLRRIDLFVVDLGDGSLRYHHIFHNFLEQLTDPDRRLRNHARAAEYYRTRGDLDETIYHLFRAGNREGAASLMDDYGAQLLAAGRLDTLAAYLDGVGGLTGVGGLAGVSGPEILQSHPALLFYLGELARLRSRFQEALGWYQQAEAAWRDRGRAEGVSRALRGQARVYLDTVDPGRAEALLEQSIRLSEGLESTEMRARMYELLAENKLNAGQIDEAEALRKQADELRNAGPSDSQLLYRVLLRTGRLEEARRRLEERAEAERVEPVLTPRAHRETHLLLSLVYALLGLGREAHEFAQIGARRGVDLQSPFMIAVGHLRLGHAVALLDDPNRYELAREQYEQANAISREIAVPRLSVEAGWGLARVHGYSGDLGRALQAATGGIEIARAAGDEWVASMIRVALGAGLGLAGRYEEAQTWLGRALQGFQECSDTFGACAARLWLCFVYWRQGKVDLLSQWLPVTLAAAEENGYDFLLTRPTLLGPPDERILTPLLVLARDRNWRGEYAARLLAALGLGRIIRHPGYRLRVQSLGEFAAFRGQTAIPPNSWRRAKARQLFQLLLTFRQTPLDRDQILEYLWPGMDPGAAGRNFKVTLNSLYHVLEPERAAGEESAIISRDGSAYGIRPGADVWLDAEQFTTLVARANAAFARRPASAVPLLEAALDLYRGDYLPEALYETWSAAERERLAVIFLSAADRLAALYLEEGQYGRAVEVAHRLLAADDCWERAYRYLMLACHRLGDHGQVARVYHRCVQTLREELDVSPAEETVALFERLTR